MGVGCTSIYDRLVCRASKYAAACSLPSCQVVMMYIHIHPGSGVDPTAKYVLMQSRAGYSYGVGVGAERYPRSLCRGLEGGWEGGEAKATYLFSLHYFSLVLGGARDGGVGMVGPCNSFKAIWISAGLCCIALLWRRPTMIIIAGIVALAEGLRGVRELSYSRTKRAEMRSGGQMRRDEMRPKMSVYTFLAGVQY
jgi:hypothetical protein